MNIVHSEDVPDGTYFRTGDAEPTVNSDGSLTILNGDGTRRSWGRPGVTSTVVMDECDLVVIHVGFHHKHGGGQFWRYYTTDGTTVRQVTWSSFSDEVRQSILAAAEKHAPRWAKTPGKLRSQYRKPSDTTLTTYKLVKLDGDNLYSLYDAGIHYMLGKRIGEAVNAQLTWEGTLTHDGGYYSHPSIEQVKQLWTSGSLVPQWATRNVDRLALIECEISGKIVEYPNGKLCSTYIKPIRIVEEISHAS